MNAYQALMKFYPLGLEDLPGELWKPIPGWQDYQESSYGRTKSFHNGKQRIVKPKVNNQGYLCIALWKNSKRKDYRVSRLVALCFIPNPDNKPQVNHIDGNKFNNHVSNLEWVTDAENKRHAVDIGLRKSGQDHYKAKLTAEQVEFIRNNPDSLSGIELSKMFGVTKTTISKIQLGKVYKKTGGVVRDIYPYPPWRTPDNIREQILKEHVPYSHKFGAMALAKKYGICQRTVLNIIHEAQS